MTLQRTTRRVFALIGAVSFLLSTAGEAFGLFPCPYHDTLQDVDARTGAVDAGHGPHHHHDGASSSFGDFGHSNETDAGPDLCTHFEACQNTAGSVLAGLAGSAVVVTYTTHGPALAAPADRVSVLLLPFFLPYPNAPPTLG